MNLFKHIKLKTKLIGMITGLLFVSCAIILLIGLTSLRKAVYAEKSLQTRELVNVALATLGHYHAMEVGGALKREEAQGRAREAIKAMKFGERSLDYYWINDFHPRMIMHPFRPDLNGEDLSGIRDPDGLNLFLEFVKVCREKGKGYVPTSGSIMMMPKGSSPSFPTSRNSSHGNGLSEQAFILMMLRAR